MLNEMLSQEDRNLIEHLYSYHLALVSNSGLTDESFKSTQESARGNFKDISTQLRPWTDEKAQSYAERDQMAADWEKFFGWDMDDPVALKKWQDEGAGLVEEAAETATRRNAGPDEVNELLAGTAERVKERRAKAYRNR